MKLNVECKACHKIFDAEVGKITFGQGGTPEPQFEKMPDCPRCGVRKISEIFLTETGQGQLTDVFMES